MRTSEPCAEVSKSVFALHRDLENPKKDATGQVRGNRNYRYLSLPALIDHAKKPLRDASLAIMQEVTFQEYGVGVVTRFVHISGEWIELGPTVVPVAGDDDPQAVGSAITYARRYALAAALNLAADEDDDASSATSSPVARSQALPHRDGGAERGGADDRGEGSTVPPQTTPEGDERTASPEPAATPSGPSEAQRYMDEFHKGRPHKMKQSETVRNMQWCTGYGDVRCPYAIVTEGAKA